VGEKKEQAILVKGFLLGVKERENRNDHPPMGFWLQVGMETSFPSSHQVGRLVWLENLSKLARDNESIEQSNEREGTRNAGVKLLKIIKRRKVLRGSTESGITESLMWWLSKCFSKGKRRTGPGVTPWWVSETKALRNHKVFLAISIGGEWVGLLGEGMTGGFFSF